MVKSTLADNNDGKTKTELHNSILSDHFLRLPPTIAVRRYNQKRGKWEYQLLKDLQKRVLKEFHRRGEVAHEHCVFTFAVERLPSQGLGVTLTICAGWVRVYSLSSRSESYNLLSKSKEGPRCTRTSTARRIEVGDIVLGVNGYTVFELASNKYPLLHQVVAFMKSCQSPVVLHLYRAAGSPTRSMGNATASLLDATMHESFQSESPLDFENKLEPCLHPLTKTLVARGILASEDQLRTTELLRQFTERAQQWEEYQCFRISDKFRLLPTFPRMGHAIQPPSSRLVHSCPRPSTFATGPSTNQNSGVMVASWSSYPGLRSSKNDERYSEDSSQIFIPLAGVRKALSVRILDYFADGQETAYTIWVHDVEIGHGWYAPVRYLRDFEDLRIATVYLQPEISSIPFPSNGWFSFERITCSETDATREAKCRQLEHFLRSLCAILYTSRLHPAVAQVAIHVQSFLGCDGDGKRDSPPCVGNAARVYVHNGARHSEDQLCARSLLKRSLEMYTFRVCLLDPVNKIVSHFVDISRAKGPGLEEIGMMQAQDSNTLKKRALEELQKINGMIDQLQNMLLEGCMEDFRTIAQSEQFKLLNPFIAGKNGESYLETLIREAVREQVEIEVYIPLRGTASRLLVNAFRHEDLEVSFKLQELRRRQNYPHIPADQSRWESVSELLKNVSICALPCAKLRAIADAAGEICRLYQKGKGVIRERTGNGADEGGESKLLGGDEFLPLFIFYVIQADMDRPCALCALLRAFCDPINRLGEVGYYLASFEASISHIRELDLSESQEDFFSFLSVPLQGHESFDEGIALKK